MADAKKVTTLLLRQFPDPQLALRYTNPLELLIAVILSAQCTDARVNAVTKTLFGKYRTAEDYAAADPEVFAEEIRSTGFYRNKAKLVQGCCRKMVSEYGGQVPRTLDALLTLPGVGRKTANMVLGNAFGAQEGISVDTHVLRVANRLGLARAENADEVERQLMAQLPKEDWTRFSNAMILHGRQVCTARNPQCAKCVLYGECEWPEKPAIG